MAPADVTHTLRDAIAEFRAGRRAEAAAMFRKVLALDPENPDALHFLGAIAHQGGNHHEAIECIRRAIDACAQPSRRIAPNPIAYNNLGEAYRALARTEEAARCYESALAIRPDYAEAHYHLGLTLEDRGRNEDAIVHYRRAVALKPELAFAHFNLGSALKGSGRLDEAASCFREALRLDPGNEKARYLLAAVLGQTPEHTPDQYVVHLFDGHAPNFDEHLVDRLQYSVPQDLVTLALRSAGHLPTPWNVLDLGCGTGLVGAAIAPHARSLIGVDLSGGMLERARARNLYARLEQRDLLEMMKQEADSSYDIVVAADVFIYVGKLDDVFVEAKRLLRSGGLIAFSVESLDETATGPDYRLTLSGRYAHSSEYLRRLATASGLRAPEIVPTKIRLESGVPVQGWLAVLRAP